MFRKKYVAMPGVPNIDGTWQQSTDGCEWINDKVNPFFTYADYYEKHHGPGGPYDVAWDWYGPQFYGPSQCLKTTDWSHPKKSSPLIAIIGSQTNITD